MKQKAERGNYISALMALAAVGVFAVCVLAVLFAGTESYRSLTQRDQLTYENRTCIGFLTTKVRQASSAEEVSVIDSGGIDVLVFREKLEGEEYETLVYCYEGWLMEYFVMAGTAQLPEDLEFGERILPVESMHLELSDGLLRAELATEGESEPAELVLMLRGGSAVVREEADYEE